MSIKSKLFTHHADPAHGWLAVTVADCNAVNLIIGSLSRFSYIKGNDLYLEEDCDASKFFAAFVKTYGHEPAITEVYSRGSSFIRNLPRITA